MRTKIKVSAAVITAALAGSVYFATSASAGPSNPGNTPGGTPGGTATDNATIPPRVFAVVNADSTKLRGKAVASIASLGTGVYDVRFNRNISACAWTGTVGLGTFGGSTGSAMISVSGRAGTNNGLFVQTFNGAAAPTNLPFTVVVICS